MVAAMAPIFTGRDRRQSVLFLACTRLSSTNVRLLAAFQKTGVAAEWLPPEAAESRVCYRDTVLARIDVLQTLDGVEPQIWELQRLEDVGIRLLNPTAALLSSHDKLATALLLHRAGIPHPATAHVDLGGNRASLDPPIVVKPRFGSWGRDVHLCRTRAQLSRRLQSLRNRRWFQRHGALLQEFVPPAGRDLRLIVAGHHVVGAVERIAAPGEWRTNVARGARRQPVIPPLEACDLAVRAAAAVGGDLVGVDLLPRPDGRYVLLEVNGAVEFTDHYSLGGRNVFAEGARVVTHALQAPQLALVGGERLER
jgi:[lysine-biosynthesis-protein LysW]---L-2-aminoadipate ligase